MIFLTVLFFIVSFLLAFALMGDKGKHTIHARKSTPTPNISKIGKSTAAGSVQITN